MSPSNIAASVRGRLLNNARETKRPFQELLQYYALERFLYRFSVSKYKEQFVLKGALMLRAWNAPMIRPTKDIDLLGSIDNSIETLESVVRTVCTQTVADDGISFDPLLVKGELIKEDSKYSGVRVKFLGRLDKAKVPMQIDVGFGDVVFPEPEITTFPTMLEFEIPQLKMYSRESVIAEKFQTMVDRGTLNSRMKDFFDVVLLSKQFAFDEKILATAIQQTFANRNTLLNASPSVFEPSFPADEHIGKQWRAFLKKGMKGIAAENFESVIADIRVFLQPVIEALVENRSLVKQWPAAHGNNDKRRPSEVNHSVSKWKSDNRVRSIFCAMYN